MKVYILSIKNEKTCKEKHGDNQYYHRVFEILRFFGQHILSASFAPPRMWKWRCFTVWQASSPQLEITL